MQGWICANHRIIFAWYKNTEQPKLLRNLGEVLESIDKIVAISS